MILPLEDLPLRDQINEKINEALRYHPGVGVCRKLIHRRMFEYWLVHGVVPELRVYKRPTSPPQRFSAPAPSDTSIPASQEAALVEQPADHVLSGHLQGFPLTQPA
jgi:hypothetical protein